MKKILFWIAVVGMVSIVSCEKKIAPSKPFPIGTWRTTNQYFNLDISPKEYIEELKELGWAKEKEISLDVSEAEMVEITFREDLTGYGSGLRFKEEGRYTFDFTWILKDDGKPAILKTSNSLTYDEYIDHFYWLEMGFPWEIEEYSANKMVLVWREHAFVDNFDGEGPPGWTEEYTCRYTFERVE